MTTQEEYKVVPRHVAEQIVFPHIVLFPNESGVSQKGIPLEVVKDLMPDHQFVKLLDDPIRNKGPKPETLYPWNVIDYLTNLDPRKKH